MTEEAVQKYACKFCVDTFDFEESTIYKDLCSRCAEQKYPLTFAVRKRVQESHGTDAARDIFSAKHDGCLPDSMISDDLMVDIIALFKAIGHVVAEAAGLPEDRHTVLVEPSYEDTTWWIITKNPPDTSLPEAAKSQIVLFDYIKAWHLGGNIAEDDVEEMLQDWKDAIVKSMRDVRLVEDAVQVLKGVKLSLLRD